MLASHEEAEEDFMRPVTRRVAGDSIADGRNEEEEHADEMLAALGKLDIGSAEFDTTFADFQNAVAAHAEHEEADESRPSSQPGSRAARQARPGSHRRIAEDGS